MPETPARLSLHLDLVPLDLAWGDPARNLALSEEAIIQALRENPDIPSDSRIFVFPEVSLTGFQTTDAGAFALERDSAQVRGMMDLAKRHRVGIIFGFPEKLGGSDKPYNTLIFASPDGGEVADYRKIHLYTAGAAPESEHYVSGDSGSLAHYRGWKIGFGLCFDLRFPSLFQSYAREGADLVILPACWIGGPGKADQFRILSAARAIEGQFFFAALNRSGKDPTYFYEGDVWCFSPRGVARPPCAKGAGGFDLDPALLDEARHLSIRASDREQYPIVIS